MLEEVSHFPLRSVTIKGLWNTPHRPYSIPLNNHSPVTLIHGLNGCGKTTFLKLLSFFGTRRFPAMTGIVFESLTLEYAGGTLTVSQNERTAPESDDEDRLAQLMRNRRLRPEVRVARDWLAHNRSAGLGRYHAVELNFSFIPAIGGATEVWSFRMTDDDWAERISNAVETIIRGGYGQFTDLSTGREYSSQELISAFRDYPGVVDYQAEPVPQWLRDLIDSCDLKLVETQRLQRFARTKADSQFRYRARGEQQAVQRTVDWCAADMQSRLTTHYSKFAEKSQELDPTFTIRVLAQESSEGDASVVDREQLKRAYDKVRQRQRDLADAKIYGDTQMPEFPTRRLTASECGMLVTFVSDMDHKLAAFDSLFHRVKLFLETMNGLLQAKELELDAKKDGILVRIKGRDSSQDQRLPLSALSSGEQHLLVLFYEVIFQPGQKPTLMMIDEPEISLHISWQEQLLDLLEKACELSGAAIIVATHSPQVVNGRPFVVLSPHETGFDEETEE
jgi:predicted ATPase